jgi:uncharacterized membrane protein
MIFLLLIAIITGIGTLIAAPLFEFVFGVLLLVPILRFLMGYALLKGGYAVPNGAPSFALYMLSFAGVLWMALRVFGRRKEPVEKQEYFPIVFFAGLFSLAYFLCMQWADFVDLGERLRDYAILSSSIQSPVQPLEPWMEGIKLNYYVYWYRFGNLLSTLLGVEVWQAYHIIASFSISFYGAVLFQLVRVVMRGGLGLAFVAGVLIPFGSNVAGTFSLKRAERGFGWEPDNGWWGPSRVLQGAIDEFPAWSFVLGDAHPHYLNLAALPFFVLILYRILSSGCSAQFRMSQAALFTVGATLFLMASNAWEVPMWLGTVGAVAVVGWFLLSSSKVNLHLPSLQGRPVFEIVKGVVSSVLLLAALVGVALYGSKDNLGGCFFVVLIAGGLFAMSFPFKLSTKARFSGLSTKRPPLQWVAFWGLLFVALKISSQHIVPEGVHLDMVRSPIPVTTTSEIVMHWGWQLLLLATGSLLLLRFSVASIVMVGFLGLALTYDKAALLLYCLLGFQVVRLLVDKESGSPQAWHNVFGNAIIIAGLVLILTPEIVFVNDSYGAEIERMNTIFKLYTTAWGLLGLGAVSVMHRSFLKFGPSLARVGSGFPYMMGGAIVAVLCVATTGFYLHTAPMRWGGLESKGATLAEGLDTANKWHPGSATVIRKLRQLPKGRVLEAQGRAYSYTGFVATLSSQPAYLGWANHINLLTKEYEEVNRRQKVTESIYNESDCLQRKELAKKEKIRYIVVGTLEQKAHSGAADKDYSCFAAIVKADQYALYQIPLS